MEATRTTLRRALHVLTHGDPKTLREILAQEAAAQTSFPAFDPEELAYTHGVLAPLLETPVENMPVIVETPVENMPVIVAALFGDTAAASLGYPTLGLSDNAGLVLAV